MTRLLYKVLVFIMLPWAFVHLVWRARRQPDYLRHWGERLGHFSGASPTRPLIWIHAVSVGETRAAQPLLAALRQRYPQHQILMTHMTPTGRDTSEVLFGNSIMRCYLPYDTKAAVRRFLGHFRPQFGLIMETELWPNLIAGCRESKTPLLLVNARMSARSARRYGRMVQLTQDTLRGLTAIAAISASDAERLTQLGATGPHLPMITGNMKFDIEPPASQLALAEQFKQQFGNRKIFLAASTREGEEHLLLEAWISALEANTPVGAGDTPTQHPLLILVPRHPQRFAEVAQLIQTRGLLLQKRSEGSTIDVETEVLLGDSMGEMFAWYAAADVAFIGGSLLDFGSQNLIEACAVGTPVLLGPSTFNFAEAANEALECGAARRFTNATDLVRQALSLLSDAASRTEMSASGRAFSQRHRGATERTLALIARVTQ
jgi:3-deoxy-D-manno-octulosonic-acid transferase